MVQTPVSSAAGHTLRQLDKRLIARLGVLALLLFVELMVVSLHFDAYIPRIFDGAAWFGFLAYAGQFAKFAVVVIAAMALAIWTRLIDHFDRLRNQLTGYGFHYFIVLQLLAFALFYWCTSIIFGEPSQTGSIASAVIAGWFAALLALAGTWLLSVAPWRYWATFVGLEKKALAFSLLVGVAAWWLARSSQELWGPLSELTFYTSAWLLALIYPEVIVDPAIKNLGTYNFIVNIAPACSGYEGIGLVTIFTAFYLSIFRKEFRFPQALLLFPIGILTIWLFNAVRIVALIAIGSSISEEVALGGFHSQAGWISFILVIFGLLMVAHKLPFFYLQLVTPASSGQPLGKPAALLIPFIVLLASTILTTALSADFDWLYPLRVVAVAIALAYCWKHYELRGLQVKLEPIIAGCAVFVVWLLLVPNDPAQNDSFAQTLFGSSREISSAWLAFRFLGAVVTVPLVEELLFRGYLLARLAKDDMRLEGRLAFSWFALLASSALFGLLHSDWIAGALAGLAYGVVRYRSNSVMDAVIAHAVTNLLLSLFVLSTGNWSLW